MALNVARFSSKKDSSIVTNLTCIEGILRNTIVWQIEPRIKKVEHWKSYLIKFDLMDEEENFCNADFESPPSRSTARSTSLAASFPNSTRLLSEWLPW